jgi:uncharacterized protein YkwD
MTARFIPPVPALFLISLVLFTLSACGSGSSLQEGYWQGSRITFQVADGKVADIRVSNISCNGETDCYEEFFHVNPALTMAISANRFSGILETAAGTLELNGVFVSPIAAEGTYTFTSSNDCCAVTGTWAAEFVKPFDKPLDDLGEGDTPPDDDTVSPDDLKDDTPPASDFYPPSATQAQIVSIGYVNELREILDLPSMTEIEDINSAAQAHAEYFEMHCSQYMSASLSPHSENPSWPEGFTGANFYDRMQYFGYQGSPGWEVMAFVGSSTGSVDGWMATLYHRIPFVHPGASEMGYGMVKGGCYRWSSGTDVMNFGRSSGVSLENPVAYPYDGQQGVVPGWGGNESPQPPLPPGSAYPSGPIITLTFSDTNFSITEHTLLDDMGNELAHMYVDPSNDPFQFLKQTISLYSLMPLKGNALHTVKVTGTWKSQTKTWEWSFTTGPTQDWYM